MNYFDQCSGRTLHPELSWLNEPEQWQFEKGALHVAAPAGGDFFVDPGGAVYKDAAPFLYAKVRGDFTVITQVKVEMQEIYDSGCLMIMADRRNWAKLCYELFPDHPSIVSVVTRGTSDDSVAGRLEIGSPYLRAARSGNTFAFHYSLDGVEWRLVRYFGMDVPEEVMVGIVAQSPVGAGSRSVFERLHMIPQATGDIRTVGEDKS